MNRAMKGKFEFTIPSPIMKPNMLVLHLWYAWIPGQRWLFRMAKLLFANLCIFQGFYRNYFAAESRHLTFKTDSSLSIIPRISASCDFLVNFQFFILRNLTSSIRWMLHCGRIQKKKFYRSPKELQIFSDMINNKWKSIKLNDRFWFYFDA